MFSTIIPHAKDHYDHHQQSCHLTVWSYTTILNPEEDKVRKLPSQLIIIRNQSKKYLKSKCMNSQFLWIFKCWSSRKCMNIKFKLNIQSKSAVSISVLSKIQIYILSTIINIHDQQKGEKSWKLIKTDETNGHYALNIRRDHNMEWLVSLNCTNVNNNGAIIIIFKK